MSFELLIFIVVVMYVFKISIRLNAIFISLFVIFIVNSISAQNFVDKNSEFSIFSTIDLTSSTTWETDKSATPGYFTWLADANDYEGASDKFHINGYVKKNGNNAFTFPVGNGFDLRTLSISESSNFNSEYAVAWLHGNPNLTVDPSNGDAIHSTSSLSGYLTAVSEVGQWDWIPINDSGSGIHITVSIPAVDGYFFTNPNDLRLVGWNGRNWVDIGIVGASGLIEDSNLSGTMITGIEAIGIGSIKPSLPSFEVVLNPRGFLSVSGKADKNNFVLITFPDGTEINTSTDSQGNFGPITSNTPQINIGVVTVVSSVPVGSRSDLAAVDYNFTSAINVAEAFSPNGDGINDTWQIYGIDKFPNSIVRVFNKWGNEVFFSRGYRNDWDGSVVKDKIGLPFSNSFFYQIDLFGNGSIDKQGWIYITK